MALHLIVPTATSNAILRRVSDSGVFAVDRHSDLGSDSSPIDAGHLSNMLKLLKSHRNPKTTPMSRRFETDEMGFLADLIFSIVQSALYAAARLAVGIEAAFSPRIAIEVRPWLYRLAVSATLFRWIYKLGRAPGTISLSTSRHALIVTNEHTFCYTGCINKLYGYSF